MWIISKFHWKVLLFFQTITPKNLTLPTLSLCYFYVTKNSIIMDVQTGAAPKLSKKQVRKTVYEKLSVALSDYKELNQKKFEDNLKKATKILASDIRKALNKKGPNGKKSKEKPVSVKIAKA